MIVQGRHRVVEVKTLDVEIDPYNVLHDIYWKATSKPQHAECIKDGFWYVHDYFDYHKREDVSKKDREATEEEIKLFEAYKTLKTALGEIEKNEQK